MRTIAIAILLLLSSCSKAPISKAEWLIGSWQFQTPDGKGMETWTKQSDTLFLGKSHFIAGGDTVSSESIQLLQSGKELYYIPSVSNQNEGKSVRFKLTGSGEKHLVFENPEHDFPQKITYTKLSESSIEAEISGTVQGKYQSEKFSMEKVK